MRAGLLRHRVRIERATQGRDAHGGITQTWSLLAHRWADVRPITARERVNAGEVLQDLTHTIEMRHFDGLTAKDRIVYGTRVFAIEQPPMNVRERNITTTLMAREVV